MRYIALILVLACAAAAASADEWQVLKGEHFLVYHSEDVNFAREVLRYAERYYVKIASDLGYSRYDKFWQWEDRVKIYIYRTRGEFIQHTGAIGWAEGMVRYEDKIIASHKENKLFLNSLLPHELTHLIFRDFVGLEGDIPLWLDEGVAQWEEEHKRREAAKIVKDLIEKEEVIPLAKLTEMDVRKETDTNTARNFYAEAITVVGYLIEKYGGSKFTSFCRQLRDGKKINDALRFVYTNSIRDIGELEKKWIEYYRR